VLAFLLLPFFASATAHAFADCNNEGICNCQKACSTRCTPSPGLPLLSCGQWGYDCIGSPSCNLLASSSTESTRNASSINASLQSLFSTSTPLASIPAQGR